MLPTKNCKQGEHLTQICYIFVLLQFVLGFLPTFALHGCGFVKFATVTFGIFSILSNAHFGLAGNILSNFVIFACGLIRANYCLLILSTNIFSLSRSKSSPTARHVKMNKIPKICCSKFSLAGLISRKKKKKKPFAAIYF